MKQLKHVIKNISCDDGLVYCKLPKKFGCGGGLLIKAGFGSSFFFWRLREVIEHQKISICC